MDSGESAQPSSARSGNGVPGFIVGLIVGGILGFLFRPSVPFLGQLPFDTVITRGGNLTGLDMLLKATAEQSFNYMIGGAIACGMLGAIIGGSMRSGGSQKKA